MDDLTLVKKIKEGDMASLEELIKKYNILISKFVFSIVHDYESTNDIVQEVFITMYNKLHMFKEGSNSFSAWLYKIAKNKSIDFIRKNSRYFIPFEEIEKSIFSHLPSLDENLYFLETKDLVEKYIKKQNFVNRRILYLKYQNEKITFKEIGQMLNISEDAVKKRYYKMHKQYVKFAEKHLKGGVIYEL